MVLRAVLPYGESLLPLIGRGEEWATLSAALQRAASGLGQVAILEGEAGIGRTRLARELRPTAETAGFVVRVAAADELESRRPFGVLADALGITRRTEDDADRAELTRLLYGVAPVSGELEFRIGEAVVDHLERYCARGPVLLVLEDLHWADPSTVTCLVQLGRVCSQLPLLVLLSARPQPRSRELDRVFDGLTASGADRLALEPLTPAAVAELVAAMVGMPPGPNLREQLSRTGGNPLLAIELLAMLAQDEAIDAAEGAAEIGQAAVRAVPSLTILHRLSVLNPATLELLSLASILGSTFALTELSLLSGRGVADLAGPIREGLRAGTLAEHGERLAFRHALIRDALYFDLPAPVRAALHRDHARALAHAGYPPGAVAEHLLHGAQPGDAEAVEWLRRAAEEAAGRAPDVALELLDRALALADPAGPLRGRLAADRAVVLLHSGRPADGEAACRRVLARRDDPEREPTLRWLLMRSLLVRGRVFDALGEVDDALALPTASPAERARYLAWAAFARLRLAELDRAGELAYQASQLAESASDPIALAESLHVTAQVLAFQGRLAESAEYGLRAVQTLRTDPVAAGPPTVTATAGLMLIATDRADEGRRVLDRGRRLAESLGAASALALHHIAAADGLFLLGEWDDATAEIETGTSLLEGQLAWPAMSHGVLALIAVHRDDLRAVRAHLAAAATAAQAGAEQMREHRLVLARALLTEATGDHHQALDELRTGWDRITAGGFAVACPELGPELVRRLVAAGAHPWAAEVTAAVESCARHNPGVATIEGAALVCRGMTQQSPALLLDAVAAYRRGAQPLAHALACEDTAVVLAATGDAEQARALQHQAHEMHQQLGAYRDAARTAAALRSLGARRGTRAPRTRDRSGWAALTPTEHRVAELVAEHLSNPDIAARMYLSRRTVETHVSHALAKLGLRSRTELAAAAIQHTGQETAKSP